MKQRQIIREQVARSIIFNELLFVVYNFKCDTCREITAQYLINSLVRTEVRTVAIEVQAKGQSSGVAAIQGTWTSLASPRTAGDATM